MKNKLSPEEREAFRKESRKILYVLIPLLIAFVTFLYLTIKK